MDCRVCGDTLITVDVKEKVHKGLGKYRMMKTGTRTYCPYCAWKGTTGPGAMLKKAIKNHNKKGG